MIQSENGINWNIIAKKTLLGLSCFLLVCVLLFAYLSNIQIDEGTQQLYATLDTLFIIFLCLSPFALAFIICYIISYIRQRREELKGRNKSRLNRHYNWFDVINMGWMTLFCLNCIFPIIYVLVGSFNQGQDYSKGGVYFYPRLFTFENYRVVLEKAELWKSYFITIARTVLGTLTALTFTSAVAYPMSRPNLRGKKFFYWANIFTMFFGGGIVPYYLIIYAIGLFDSFWVYIIPSLYSVYNMIVISSFFRGISDEIHDSCKMDGAGEVRIWRKIYMPLSKPVLATVALWLAVGHWNSYFDTMLFTKSSDLHTLQYFLIRAIKSATMIEGMPESMLERITPKTISLAAIILSTIPVLFFFPFVRKGFQSGIMLGSLKG